MKLPENYQTQIYLLLLHLQTEPSPHNNVKLRDQLRDKIKNEDFGELMAYALKQNLIYINYKDGVSAYTLTNKAKALIQKFVYQDKS